MRCFELTNRGVVSGFRVEDHPSPHAIVTSDAEGGYKIDLNPRLGPLIQWAKKERPGDLVRACDLAPVPPEKGDYMNPCPPDSTALVYLSVTAAPPRGRVILEAADNRGQYCKGNEVITWFAPFPEGAPGISVFHNPYGRGKTPWMEPGLPKLELMLVMMKGASFRIFRTEAPRGVQRSTFVKWHGSTLEATRWMGRGAGQEART